MTNKIKTLADLKHGDQFEGKHNTFIIANIKNGIKEWPISAVNINKESKRCGDVYYFKSTTKVEIIKEEIFGDYTNTEAKLLLKE